MAIDELIADLDRHLTDERVLQAVQEFLTAIEHQLQYDSETIVFAPDVTVHVLDKSLVLDRAHRDGAYLTARAVLDPLETEQGQYSGCSRGGSSRARRASGPAVAPRSTPATARHGAPVAARPARAARIATGVAAAPPSLAHVRRK